MSPVLNLRDAAQASCDHFIGAPFQWGRYDCAKMVTFHLRHLGISLSIAKAGRYATALGAYRALKRLGFESLADVLDGRGLQRIAPASRVAGDIIELPSSEALGSLAVAVGNGRVLGYHESLTGADILQPLEMITAWRPIVHG